MRVQLEHKDTIRQSLQIAACSVCCIGNTSNIAVWATHRTSLYRQHTEHRCIGNTPNIAVWATHRTSLYRQHTEHRCMGNTLNTWSRSSLHEKTGPKAQMFGHKI